MKIKSLVSIILVLILCLSTFLVSCTPKDNGEPAVNADPEKDKEVISDKLSGGTIGEALENLESQEVSFDFSEVYDEMAKLSFDADLDLDTEMLDSLLSVAMKNGIFEASAEGEQAYIALGKDLSLSTISPFGNGYWIEVEEMMPSDVELPSEDTSIEDLLAQVPEEILNIVKEFSFPKIDEDEIELDDDWYIISDKYYEAVAESVLDLIVDIAESQGGETPTEDEYNDALDTVSEVIDALNLEIGFAVVGENIVGVKVSVDADIDKMNEIGNGSGTPPTVAPEYSPLAKKDSEEKMKASVEMWLTDDAMFLSSIKLSLDVAMEGAYAKGKLTYKYSYKDTMLSGMSVKADMEISEDEDEVITMKGEISTDLIFDGNEICGVEVDADMDLTNVDIGGGYYETNTYGEKYVTCNGDVSIDASLVMDFSTFSEVDKKVVSADIDCNVTGTSMYYYNYGNDGYGYEISGGEKSTDMSIFRNPPKLSDFSSAIEVYGAATVTSEDVLDVAFMVTMNGETPVDVTGSLNISDTVNVALPDGLDADTLAEDYARIKLEAEALAEELYYQWTPYAGYYIHDAQSGLYAYISAYGYVQNIGTVAPTDSQFVNQYGTYMQYN